MSARSALRLLTCIGLCFGIAIIAGQSTTAEIPTWYATLNKPSWTPPNWVFPAAWSVLYLMLAISLWLLWSAGEDAPARRRAITLSLVQLALNGLWSPIFFSLHQTRLALAVIVLMIIFTIATMRAAWPVDRRAAWLLVPYLVWILYASSLNVGIIAMNP
jgi:tryptophan-rich sensory protein